MTSLQITLVDGSGLGCSVDVLKGVTIVLENRVDLL
jgi:hypothetical protein